MITDQKTAAILPLTDLTPQLDNMRICFMNKAVVLDNTSHKPIMLTGGVSTCLVVIIHHPLSKLTVFSHMNSSENMIALQNQFISYFDERQIPESELHVYLAGGIKSFFESEQAANTLNAFWQSKNVTLNTELLLSRDYIHVPNYADFLGTTYKLFEQLYCKALNITLQDVEYYIKNLTQEGFLYNLTRRKNKNYPAEKWEACLSIEVAIEVTTKQYLVARGICQKEYTNEHQLLMIQYIQDPFDVTKKRLLVDFHDPHRTVLHIIGFNIEKNELFIATDDCNDFIDSVALGTERAVLEYDDSLSIADLTKNKNDYGDKTESTFKFFANIADDAHARLIKSMNERINPNFKDLNRYYEMINEKQYSKALRTACNSCHSLDDKNTINIIELLCIYKEELSININEKNLQGNTAIHYAALKGNRVVYNLLLTHDADPNLTNNQGICPSKIIEKSSSQGLALT